ncbi:hypothetical protein PanWU01x14_221380 [Parasponia andersonii]|uniref:Uncharacterized protein n=1 Tax=Parasponia andersonii TaxID=3476 RepID=A0A2P5BPQ9_PARAD|nr:hypothetical protein PanWU01x14_221380 [Parasponia andersonii]
MVQIDAGFLVAQIRDLEKKNAELEEQNKRLISKEQNTVASLRKALKDVAMEKDATVVAHEDFSAQFQTLEKHLKEAEEGQAY